MPEPTCVAPDADALARLAADLVGADAGGHREPPLALAVRACDVESTGGVDAAILPLVTAHASGGGADDPVVVLCHQRPDPDWAVVGVLADGWSIPPAETDGVDWRTLVPQVAPSRHPSRRRVRTLHLVSRSGAVAMALLFEGDDVPDVHATDDGGEVGGPCGPLPDALRRMFGLPTPPCPVAADELWASLWLEAVAALAGRGATWSTVAHLHPAAWLADELDLELTPEHLVVAGRALSRSRGWDRLQLDAVTDPGDWDLFPSPDVAAWADTAMFARLVLRRVHPLWSSHRELERALRPDLLATVRRVLGAWGLDVSPPGSRAA